MSPVQGHAPAPGFPRRRRRLLGKVPRHRLVLAAGLMFVAIFVLRLALSTPPGATVLLFVVPVALCATAFGMRGGALAATVAVVLAIGGDAAGRAAVGPVGIAIEGAALLLLGGLLGRVVDGQRTMERQVERYFELSLDLLCTATFDGYFEWVNPAWEKTLGHTQAELVSRPFIDFVHPADRERTQAEAAKLAEIGTDTISFRNRYRAADGSYRWLEWNTHAVAEERRLYAAARDITSQQRAEEAIKAAKEEAERANRALKEVVDKRTEELTAARLEIVERLAIAAEYRDDETGEHIQRVGRTAGLIAGRMGLEEQAIELIRNAAPLHDVGKIGIPDHILLKPGRLTDEEFEVIKLHVEIGGRILSNSGSPLLNEAAVIAITHHERWDGKGYTAGLSGKQIPVAGRVVAVADVFDALTHDRPYKEAWPLERALAEIRDQSGRQFDPEVVEAFEALDHAELLEPVEREPKGAAARPRATDGANA